MSSCANLSSGIASFRENVCRTCLLTSPKALHPLQDQDKQALLNLCNVQVRSVGVLPCRLCGVCRLRLQRIQQFVSQARGAQDALMDYLLNNHAEDDDDPILQINIDTLRDLRDRCFPAEGLGFSKLVTVDCKEDDEIKSENSATFTNCIKWLSLEDDANLEQPSRADIKHEVDISDGESEGGGEYGELLLDRIKEEPDVTERKVTTKKSARKKVKSRKSKQSKMKKAIMKVLGKSKAAGRTTADTSEEVSCSVVEDCDVIMDKGSLSGEYIDPDDLPLGSKSVHRDSFQHFDRSLVHIIKLTLDEQLQELEEARKSDKYTLSPYKCAMCAKHFAYELTYKTHMKKHTEEAGKVSCPICRQRFKSHKSLAVHLNSHSEQFQCSKCGVKFKTRCAISTHLHKHSASLPQQNYQCKQCGEINHTYPAHRRHTRSHQDRSKHKCHLCPKAFAEASLLANHVARHNGIKNYSCPQCERMFVSRGALRLHSTRHSSNKDFYCVECNANFKTRASLEMHLKITKKHVQPETLRFQCDQCPRRFDSNYKLGVHLDVCHLGVSRWPCQACSMSFKTPSGLRHHRQRKHENKKTPKNNICELCGKGFGSKAILRHHVLIHTGEKPFSCSYCGTAFRQKAAMTTHIRLVHLKVNRNGTTKS